MGFSEGAKETANLQGFILTRLWFFLGSMRFAIWVLVITAVLSLSTLLITELVPAPNRMDIASRTNSIIADLINSIFHTSVNDESISGIFRFTDPFRSLWFRFLLAILAFSLLACIIQRTPRLIKLVFVSNFRDDPSQLSGYGEYSRIITDEGETVVRRYFQSNGISARVKGSDDRVLFYGRRGSISRLGPLLSHVGMLFLIAGGLVISLTGGKNRGDISGGEGQILAEPEWGFSLRIDSFRIDYYPVLINQWVETPEGFRGQVTAVYNDTAEVSLSSHQDHEISRYYPVNSLRNDFMVVDGDRMFPYQGNVRGYITETSILLDDQVVLQKNIEVNHPLRYRGYRFYQTDFDLVQNSVAGVDTVVVKLSLDEVGDTVIAIPVGSRKTDLTWGGYQVSINDFYPDFRLDRSRNAFSASRELRNPAALVLLFENGIEVDRAWAFSGGTGMAGHSKTPFQCSLVDLLGMHTVPGGFITRLSVYRENGRWLVWAGLLFATLGLILVYTFVHKQAWGIIIPAPDGSQEVHLASATRHSAPRFYND